MGHCQPVRQGERSGKLSTNQTGGTHGNYQPVGIQGDCQPVRQGAPVVHCQALRQGAHSGALSTSQIEGTQVNCQPVRQGTHSGLLSTTQTGAHSGTLSTNQTWNTQWGTVNQSYMGHTGELSTSKSGGTQWGTINQSDRGHTVEHCQPVRRTATTTYRTGAICFWQFACLRPPQGICDLSMSEHGELITCERRCVRSPKPPQSRQ